MQHSTLRIMPALMTPLAISVVASSLAIVEIKAPSLSLIPATSEKRWRVSAEESLVYFYGLAAPAEL